MSELVLFEHPLSPYSQKVKLALLEKGITFSLVNLATMSEAERSDFVAWNPRAEVPVLVHDGFAVFDSTVILEYIEDSWPQPSLLPAGARDRARVRLIEEVMDTHFEANTWGLSEVEHFGRASGDLAARLTQFGTDEIQHWLAWLNGQLGNAPYFNGEGFGWGDVCVIPFVNGATRFAIFPAAPSPLADWHQRVSQREHVTACKEGADAWELDPQLMAQALAQGFKREYRDHRLEWMVRAGGMRVLEEGLQADNLRFHTPFPAHGKSAA